MASRFICYKNVKNMKVTVTQRVIGSKSKTFLNKINVDDELYLYCKSHIWAKLIVTSEGFEDSSRLWNDDIYPYRFIVDITDVLKEPLSIEKVGGSHLLREKYGPQWGFKVLFTPNELPENLINLLNSSMKDVANVHCNEHESFFEGKFLFGLKGRKLEIEKQKLEAKNGK